MDRKDWFKRFNSGRMNFFLLGFIALVLAGAVLKLTSSLILPLTIAVLLAFVLNPFVHFLGKLHIPRILAILLPVALIIAGLYFLGIVLISSGRLILSLYPKYEERLTEIYISVADFFDLSYDEHLSFFENLWAQLGVRSRVRYFTLSFSNSFLVFLRDAFMIVLFVVFLLFEGAFFRDKIELAFEDKFSGQIKKITSDVMLQVTRYLSIKFLISLATGIVVAVGLSLAGLEFAILWGMIQFILNFIPNIGSIACGVGASVFALLQFWPEPGPVVLVVLIMLGANMIIGNILEPKIMGDNLGLSPVVILFSLIMWGWLWGFAGLILAVPMMMIIKILCENVTVLEPVSVLLASRKEILRKKAERQAGESVP
ncbi:MAG: AI-2E family transporter [Treponema sp.]|jgi:predicted PurR-regulated permease PerM|nr:AI-2E family transporter [Treponema sp.]